MMRKDPLVSTPSRRNKWKNHFIVTSSEDESSDDDDTDSNELGDGEWEINGILDESDSQYLLDWVGDWSPTWEPKENASEVAVQVWEEKKKKKEQLAVQNDNISAGASPTQQPHQHIICDSSSAETPAQEIGSQHPSESHTTPQHEASAETHTQGSESQRTESQRPELITLTSGRDTEPAEQGTETERPQDSPLFVPLDGVLEGNTQEISETLPLSLEAETSIQPPGDIKTPRETRDQGVFGYYPIAPIPPEYRLPGEFEEPFGITTQHAVLTHTASTQDSRNSDWAKTPSQDTWSYRRRQTAVIQPSPRTEIPETPSALLASHSSQVSRTGPGTGLTGSQQSANPVNIPLSIRTPRTQFNRPPRVDSPCSALSRTSIHGAADSAAQRTASVPETVLAGTVNRSPATPATQPSNNSINLPSNSGAPRLSLLTRVSLPSDLAASPQHTVGRARSVSKPAIVNASRSWTPQSSAQLLGMDESNQKKEGVSLAETMEKYSHIEGSTPREKIRNAYARLREKSTLDASQNEPSATPSSVGDIEPSTPHPLPETVAPLSIRVDKEPSHVADSTDNPPPEPPLVEMEPETSNETIQTIQPSALALSDAEQVPPGALHLGPSEFAVPLPMDSRVKDDYERVLLNEPEDVWKLMSDDNSHQSSEVEQEQVVLSMQQVLERLSNAATHPDINVAQHVKLADSNLEQEAAWAEYSSAKFLLLGYLIKAADDHDIHLVIVVRGEKTHSIVERYLRGKGLVYSRPREEMGVGTNLEVSLVKGSLSFGIQVAAHNDGIVETYKPPSALLALDSSLNTKNPSIEHMRTTFARNGHLLPVIRLLVANSSEHVELCSPGPPTTEHLTLILRHSMQLRDIVGDLQDDALGVQEDASEIMTCLLSDNFNTSWTLPAVEPLRPLNLGEPMQVEKSDSNDAALSKPTNTTAQKRVFESPDVQDTGEPGSKRPRMEESQGTSQFTVSSKEGTQTLQPGLHALEQNLIQMRSSHAATIEKLQKALASAQTRLQEREQALESLQHRYESRSQDLVKIRRERDRLIETKAESEQRSEKQKEDITKLKDERTQLKHELEEAREAIKSGGGDLAELEKAREEIRRLTKENASVERKSEYEHKQAEYTREQYQTASNVAAQSSNELRQLREENEILKRKVAGDAVRLREVNIQNDESRHLSRIAELEALLSSRQDLLHRKEEELREIRKNRPSTRATSTQPRSPKLNNANSRPSSPGINNGSNYPGRGSALRFSSEMSI